MLRNLLIIAGVAAAAHAYGSGAPDSVCEDLTPKHPADPQTGPSPYKISISENVIHAGDEVKVTLEGIDGGKFKGFIAEARVDKAIVGSFVVDATDEEVQTIDCPSGKKNAVTHKNSKEKSIITLKWVAPKDLRGVVVFKATFVKDGLTFWVAQTSSNLTVRQ